MSSSSSSSDLNFETEKNNSNNIMMSLRVLALHGSEGNGQEFVSRLQPLQTAIPSLNIHSFNAPFSQGGGYAWWILPPGERSFKAETYQGFDTSLALFEQYLNQVKPDLVLAHSQGAIFMAAYLALQYTTTTTTTASTTSVVTATATTTEEDPSTRGALPQFQQQQQQQPSVGYILNGLAWPNPFSEQLSQLVQQEQNAKTSTTAAATTKTITSTTSNAITLGDSLMKKPRILIMIGKGDSINPPASAERVVQHLQQAGFPVTTLYHEGGHALPFRNETCIAKVVDWIHQQGGGSD